MEEGKISSTIKTVKKVASKVASKLKSNGTKVGKSVKNVAPKSHGKTSSGLSLDPKEIAKRRAVSKAGFQARQNEKKARVIGDTMPPNPKRKLKRESNMKLDELKQFIRETVAEMASQMDEGKGSLAKKVAVVGGSAVAGAIHGKGIGDRAEKMSKDKNLGTNLAKMQKKGVNAKYTTEEDDVSESNAKLALASGVAAVAANVATSQKGVRKLRKSNTPERVKTINKQFDKEMKKESDDITEDDENKSPLTRGVEQGIARGAAIGGAAGVTQEADDINEISPLAKRQIAGGVGGAALGTAVDQYVKKRIRDKNKVKKESDDITEDDVDEGRIDPTQAIVGGAVGGAVGAVHATAGVVANKIRIANKKSIVNSTAKKVKSEGDDTVNEFIGSLVGGAAAGYAATTGAGVAKIKRDNKKDNESYGPKKLKKELDDITEDDVDEGVVSVATKAIKKNAPKIKSAIKKVIPKIKTASSSVTKKLKPKSSIKVSSTMNSISKSALDKKKDMAKFLSRGGQVK